MPEVIIKKVFFEFVFKKEKKMCRHPIVLNYVVVENQKLENVRSVTIFFTFYSKSCLIEKKQASFFQFFKFFGTFVWWKIENYQRFRKYAGGYCINIILILLRKIKNCKTFGLLNFFQNLKYTGGFKKNGWFQKVRNLF